MKFRPAVLFGFCLTVIFFTTGTAFAQTAPTPAAGITVTTQTAIVTVIALVAGFIGQAINSGSLFGIATTPKAWIPYLTLVGSFLAAAGLSLQSSSALNGSAFFNAIIAGFMALTSAGAGSATHTHLNAHKRLVPVAAPAAVDPPVAPPAAPPAGDAK